MRRSQPERSLAHQDGGAADLDRCQRPAFDDELEGDVARAAHLVALLDDEVVLAVAERLELHQHAGESGGGRARRRVFGDAEARGEHAGVEMMAGVGRLARVDEDRLMLAAEGLAEGVGARTGAADRLEACYRDIVEGDAGGMPARGVSVEADLARIDAERPGDLGRIAGLAPDLGQARRPEAGMAPALALDLDDAGHHADGLLEPEGDRTRLAAAIPEREQHRRPDRRMAGEGQLAAGREDAQAGAVPRLVRRQHEHGLGQVELAGNFLHRRRVKPFGIEHHGERVAGERSGREHVEGDEAAGHGASWRAPLPEGEADTAITVPVRDYSLTGSAVTPHRSRPQGEVGKSISTTTGQWSLALGRSQPTRG